MLTLMREWGRILSEESINNTSILDVFNRSYHTLEIALDKTKEQLSVLKKANVVDSGAKGFTYFIEGALHYLKNGEDCDLKKLIDDNKEDIVELTQVISHLDTEDNRYCTECLLESNDIDLETIKTKLKQLGNSIVVAGSRSKCRVHIHTNEPAVVFDFLSRHGTMIYQKVDDMYNQEAIINRRKYNIALVTDSIADLPQTLIDEHQIQIVHLDILYKGINYFDKLTIQPSRLLEMVSNEDELPTSSQPNPMQIDNLLDYLSTYCKSKTRCNRCQIHTLCNFQLFFRKSTSLQSQSPCLPSLCYHWRWKIQGHIVFRQSNSWIGYQSFFLKAKELSIISTHNHMIN